MIGSGLKDLAYKMADMLKDIKNSVESLPKIQTLLEEILVELKASKKPTKRITAFNRYVDKMRKESPEFKQAYDEAKEEIAATDEAMRRRPIKKKDK